MKYKKIKTRRKDRISWTCRGCGGFYSCNTVVCPDCVGERDNKIQNFYNWLFGTKNK